MHAYSQSLASNGVNTSVSFYIRGEEGVEAQTDVSRSSSSSSKCVYYLRGVVVVVEKGVMVEVVKRAAK